MGGTVKKKHPEDLAISYLVKELCTNSLVGRVLMKMDLVILFLVVRVLVDMEELFLEKKLCTEERVLAKIFRNGEIMSGYESSDND